MRQKYPLILICTLLFLNPLKATHIVGGEIFLENIAQSRYLLGLNLYYDQINVGFNIEDTEIEVLVRIFAKSDDRLVQSFILNRDRDKSQNVNYFRPECISRNVEVLTRLLVYENEVSLNPNIYNEPEGYYIIWERCCRNGIITNIENPGDVGMVFYLEFPPLQILNNSPRFTIPDGTFFCLNEFNTYDFSAFDPDGDSLVYSFSNPLVGNSNPDNTGGIISGQGGAVQAIPAPYPTVIWRLDAGIAFDSITAVPSNQEDPVGRFQINPASGIISVEPTLQGLFVFAVKCEEFREGVKIGEVRREFQLFALDCPVNEPPHLSLESDSINGMPTLYQPGEILRFNINEDKLCFNLWISDADPNETLDLRLFSDNTRLPNGLLPVSRVVIPGPGDSVRVELCWPRCVFSNFDNQGNLIPNNFDIVAFDNSCPNVDSDTISITSISIPADNNNPPLIEILGDNNRTIIAGESLSFDVLGRDLDGRLVEIQAVGQGFELAEVGMSFPGGVGQGSVQSLFEWQTNCDLIAEGEQRFLVDFIVTDQGICDSKTDTLTVDLSLVDKESDIDEFLPPNAFTPNSDGVNDHFFMPDLPIENCVIQFKRIDIYNRWGNKIYSSDDPNFVWDGGELPSGIYFYHLDFTGRVFRGSVSLVR